MSKYTIWLFDGTYKVVKEEDYPNGIVDVEQAMLHKTPVYLNGSLVAGSSISRVEPFGNSEDYGSGDYLRVGTPASFQLASEVFSQPSERREKIKEAIRHTIANADSEYKKNVQEYLAEVEKYKQNGRNLTLEQQERMIEERYPEPVPEITAVPMGSGEDRGDTTC